jgi:hypothetical protein
MELVAHNLTEVQWVALKDAWSGCAYCGAGGVLQRDCVLPISRGGCYTLDNVVPACPACNASGEVGDPVSGPLEQAPRLPDAPDGSVGRRAARSQGRLAARIGLAGRG